MTRSHSSIAYDERSESARASRHTGQFSCISSEASSNDEEIENELFNDENMFPSTKGKQQHHIHPQQLQFPAFELKSPQKIHMRPSMRMANTDEGARISMFRSRYSQNNPNTASKLSLTSSLVDITNISNVSMASRRTSYVSNQSNQTRRNLSFLDNASSISIEQKRNQIIQRLNKRNSKNLSNPYFYQYKENKQPTQPPPEAPEVPEEQEFSFNYENSKLLNSTFGSFSDVVSISPEKSVEESLNFNDLNPIKTHKIFTISEDKDISHNTNERRASNEINHSRDNHDDTTNNEQHDRSVDEGNDDYISRNTGNNSSPSTNHSNSHHSNRFNNSGNKTDSSKNTTSGNETTSSEECEASRRIRLSQLSHGGLFSESKFTPMTAAAESKVAEENEEEYQQQPEKKDQSDVSKTSNDILRGIEDDSNFIDMSNSNLFKSRESFATVSTGQIQTADLKPTASDNSSGKHYFAVLAQPAFTTKLLAEGSANSAQGPIITVNAMNSSDGSNESRLKKFDLSNNSSVSLITAGQKQQQQSRSETVLDLNKDQTQPLQLNTDRAKKKPLFRKPPPTSPSPVPSPSPSPSPSSFLDGPAPLHDGFNDESAKSSFPQYDDNTASNLIRSVKQSNNKQNFEMAPAVPKFPSALYSDHEGLIELNSDETDTTTESNGSRDQLLSHSNMQKKKSSYPMQGFNREPDLEKDGGTLVSDNYKREYHDYEVSGRCSDMISILLLVFSILAPPFFLIIALGYIDRVFGSFDRKYKIIAAVGFAFFCLGSAVGIAVGLGYGLTHDA